MTVFTEEWKCQLNFYQKKMYIIKVNGQEINLMAKVQYFFRMGAILKGILIEDRLRV